MFSPYIHISHVKGYCILPQTEIVDSITASPEIPGAHSRYLTIDCHDIIVFVVEHPRKAAFKPPRIAGAAIWWTTAACLIELIGMWVGSGFDFFGNLSGDFIKYALPLAVCWFISLLILMWVILLWVAKLKKRRTAFNIIWFIVVFLLVAQLVVSWLTGEYVAENISYHNVGIRQFTVQYAPLFLFLPPLFLFFLLRGYEIWKHLRSGANGGR